MGEDGMKSRSFRHEDYNYNRSVFLRSYPLRWEPEEDKESSSDNQRVDFPPKMSLKSRLVAIFHWGQDKFLILKRMKMKKMVFYLVACQPFGFKSSDKLLSTGD